ncbi:MAG: hypothetical protein MUE44_31985 [Oscillatoriaceae cyanobacterium Prado104]|nr:hypothetical protein [Oscillatoriaceae cyanobacterium Prado104]
MGSKELPPHAKIESQNWENIHGGDAAIARNLACLTIERDRASLLC